MNPFRGILLFSLIETIAVIVWALILKLGVDQPLGVQIAAGIVLFAGYVIEHIVAFNVGKGRPFFDKIRP